MDITERGYKCDMKACIMTYGQAGNLQLDTLQAGY